MKTPPDRDELLGDILDGALTPALDEQFLARTMNEVRRCRTMRRCQRAGVVLVVVAAGVGLLFTQTSRPPGEIPAQDLAVSMRHVSTTPRPPSMTLETRPGAAPIIDSRRLGVEQLATTLKSRSLEAIGDDELLMLAQNQGAALVREPGLPARLLLLGGVSDR